MSTNHCPVHLAQVRIAYEAVMYGRYRRTPHQHYNAQKIKRETQFCDAMTVVGECMVSASQISLDHVVQITH